VNYSHACPIYGLLSDLYNIRRVLTSLGRVEQVECGHHSPAGRGVIEEFCNAYITNRNMAVESVTFGVTESSWLKILINIGLFYGGVICRWIKSIYCHTVTSNFISSSCLSSTMIANQTKQNRRSRKYLKSLQQIQEK
jgi:hypothetical protein